MMAVLKQESAQVGMLSWAVVNVSSARATAMEESMVGVWCRWMVVVVDSFDEEMVMFSDE